ncbi:hypothetical protein GCM10011506_35100 [Marivirga lumbricoides]|uniref:Uncharacterized protein n=1 Tax=Marivirga lumbricoides TaxID=1046115 RepID=A0ABQ1MTX9_9BACT|nr:hypothetical protein GCM10011506_35100 [Marivirga lumbricoides]
MILGVYWYFGFPEGLYSYNYFRWKPGYGGHANNPAELETIIQSEKPEALIQDFRELIGKLQQGFIFIYQNGQNMKIGTGSFNLHDFDFVLMKQVEVILQQHQVQLLEEFDNAESQLIKIHVKKDQTSLPYPSLKLLKVVSSNMKKHNAETSSLRLDCNIPLKEKNAYLAEIAKVSEEENISVLYFSEKRFEDTINLMLFFTNGRQGLNFSDIQYVNAENIERKIQALATQFEVEFQHKGGWNAYPVGNYQIIKMVDKDFII